MKKHIKFLGHFAEWFLKFEGSWHFVGSTWTIIMLIMAHDYHKVAWFLPIMDYIMGAGTLFAGWLLGKVMDENEKNR